MNALQAGELAFFSAPQYMRDNLKGYNDNVSNRICKKYGYITDSAEKRYSTKVCVLDLASKTNQPTPRGQNMASLRRRSLLEPRNTVSEIRERNRQK